MTIGQFDRLARWVGLACVATALGGCGGFGRPPLAEPRVMVDDEEEEPPPALPAAKLATAPTPARPSRPKLPPTPSLPPDVADWTFDDCLTAREDRDPRLLELARHLVQQAGRDPEQSDRVWLLVQLLEQVSEAQPSSTVRQGAAVADLNAIGRSARSAPAGNSLAGTIVPYLATCRDKVAQQALQRILCGTLATDATDKVVVLMVIEALVADSGAASEELLHRLLTAPQEFRSAQSTVLTGDQLQEITLAAVEPLASAGLRTLLAEHIVNPATPVAHRQRLGRLLASETPENLAARIVLHNSELLNSQVKGQFRSAFASQNSEALDVLLGIRPAAAQSAPSEEGGLFVSANHPQQAGELAELFWDKGFTGAIAGDVGRIQDIGQQRELMLLACNLPCTTVRSKLHTALQRQWIAGVAPFEEARLTLDSIRDPGFLPLVKSMQSKPGASSALRSSPEQKARLAWIAASERFVRELNQRFYTAGQSGGLSAAAGELPVELHREAAITAQYHLDWPRQLQETLPNVKVAPLVVHYMRIEGDERLTRLCDFYKRQLSECSVHMLRNGRWLDSLSRDEETGRLRSADVLVTRRTNLPPRSVRGDEPLRVEILWVEIEDPT